MWKLLSQWRRLRCVLGGIAIASALLLLARGLIGPFRWVRNPINAECALAVSLLLFLLMRREPGQPTQPRVASYARWPVVVVLVSVGIAYWPILSMPLVTDDYIHIRQIASGEAPSPLGCFTQSCGGPQFFRPLGFSIYWMEWDLWGRAPAPRHALDLMLHAASSLLFLLLMRLELRRRSTCWRPCCLPGTESAPRPSPGPRDVSTRWQCCFRWSRHWPYCGGTSMGWSFPCSPPRPPA